jgi:rhodanese-related sulfurtransferase
MVAVISREELRKKIEGKEHFILAETLPKETYDHAHLPGAINIPPDQVATLAAQMLPDKSAEIVVYCSKPS